MDMNILKKVVNKQWTRLVESKAQSDDNDAAAAKSLQSCPTLCDPIDSSLPGSSVHGIFQAKVLEWGAIAFSDNDDSKN